MKRIIVVISIVVLVLSGCAVSTSITNLTPTPTMTAVASTDPTPTPTTTPTTQEPEAIEHIILSVVYVTKEWQSFSDPIIGGGFTHRMDVKEDQGVKYYEVAIWEDTLSIHLYAFSNDYFENTFDLYSLSKMKDPTDYRESFMLSSFAGMPEDHDQRSPFVLDAFTEFARILVERHPDATHNLVYSGHGGPYPGGLFEYHLNQKDTDEFLGRWHEMLGRRLGFIDMGTVCGTGSFHHLETFYKHVEYYVASDLIVCSFFDDENADRSSADPLVQYPRILAASESLEEALIERVNLAQLQYGMGKNSIITGGAMQSLYLYSCRAFGMHQDDILSFILSLDWTDKSQTLVDVRSVLVDNGAEAELLAAFDSIIVHGVHTKDYFTWPLKHEGMSLFLQVDYFLD